MGVIPFKDFDRKSVGLNDRGCSIVLGSGHQSALSRSAFKHGRICVFGRVMIVTVLATILRHGRVINNAPRWAAVQREATMTKFTTTTIRRAALTLAFAASLCAMSNASFAYTAEAQQMCTGDAFRLCSSEIPNISKITACMVKNRASLSSGCRMVMDKEAAANRSSKVAAQ
jgi:hypothetical protein